MRYDYTYSTAPAAANYRNLRGFRVVIVLSNIEYTKPPGIKILEAFLLYNIK